MSGEPKTEPVRLMASTEPLDGEFAVLGAMIDLMTSHASVHGLDDEAKARIVRYLSERFGAA